MHKVLMVTYAYPPVAGIGMLRALKFVKYLPSFGWKPVVLTPKAGTGFAYCDESEGHLKDAEIVRSHYVDLEQFILKFSGARLNHAAMKRDERPAASGSIAKPKSYFLSYLSKQLKNWLFFPDEKVGWYPYAVQKGLDYIKTHNVDLIYSTSSPETSHLIAHGLKKKTRIPWVADFRDPWTQNPIRKAQFSYLRKMIEQKVEKKIIRAADAAIMISEPFADEFRSYHRIQAEKVFTITNGFDPDDYEGAGDADENFFTIVYTGRLIGLRRNPELLFKAMAELAAERVIDLNRVKIQFYTTLPQEILGLVWQYGLQEVVESKNFIPYREALKRQQQASVLLLLLQKPVSRGMIPAKVFEYLGARKPILSIPSSSGAVDQIIDRTRSGVHVSNLSELKAILLRWHTEYIQKGTLRYDGNPIEIQKYTREAKTEKLAELFDSII